MDRGDLFFLVRIDDLENPSIRWSLEFDSPTAEELDANPQFLMTEGDFIVADQSTDGSSEDLFLVGRHHGVASMTRFSKAEGQVQWHSMISEMSHIHAITQSSEGDMYLCGDYQPNAVAD